MICALRLSKYQHMKKRVRLKCLLMEYINIFVTTQLNKEGFCNCSSKKLADRKIDRVACFSDENDSTASRKTFKKSINIWTKSHSSDVKYIGSSSFDKTRFAAHRCDPRLSSIIKMLCQRVLVNPLIVLYRFLLMVFKYFKFSSTPPPPTKKTASRS